MPLRKEETPASLSAKIWPGEYDEFDRGMMDAAREMVRRGLAEDPESLDAPRNQTHLTPMDRRCGYDYAMGALLRGDETPLSLEAGTMAVPKGDYEAGILEAIEYAVATGLVQDDAREVA